MTRLLVFLAILSLPLSAQTPPVYVVLFTHIEDNTPIGVLGSNESRQNYALLRNKLIAMANMAKQHNARWSFQPDWKILLAALMYEDSTLVQNTKGKNLLRYLKEELDVVIDPHSHESQGYNYTDVAHLLDSLGVGATTVIGGHIWDPSLPQFQNWDRFRVPVRGTKYPWAMWRGDILMGSGTPNHVNDPVVSGVWRPLDRFHYFTDDTAGNISCVGQYKGDLSGIDELISFYKTGYISPQSVLTSSYHIKPATITQVGGLTAIEDSIIKPLTALSVKGDIVLTDFTSLIAEWKTKYKGRAFIYDAKNPTHTTMSSSPLPALLTLYQNYPNPFNASTTIQYTLMHQAYVTLSILDVLGREVAVVVREPQAPGYHRTFFFNTDLPSGVYFYSLRAGGLSSMKAMVLIR